MKVLLFGLAALILAAGVTKGSGKRPEEVTLVIGGDVLGYLSPCGCTKPMAGGIRRWVSAVRSIQAQGPTVVAINGGVAGGVGRQHELKSEALAESYKAIGINALNLTAHEANLGRDACIAIQRLSGGALTTMSLLPSETLDAKPLVTAGPFLIGGAVADPQLLAVAAAERPQATDAAVRTLVREAETAGLRPILLWNGNEESARELARSNPDLVAIVFSSSNIPRGKPLLEGNTLLFTPGEKCRVLVTMRWDGTKFLDYQTVELGPEISNDEAVSRTYDRYLERVADEDLLMMMPRPSEDQFVGSDKCFTCHEKAAKVWKDSLHAKALATLEEDHHDRDPDCVGCHVVGLDSPSGFMDRAKTPSLANVGCESCHGPGAAHVANPTKQSYPKAGEKSCAKCHVPDHSPKFDFSSYWEKIRH